MQYNHLVITSAYNNVLYIFNIIWVPANVGIPGNKKANRAVKLGSSSNKNIENKVNNKDIINKIKDMIEIEWEEKYINKSVPP